MEITFLKASFEPATILKYGNGIWRCWCEDNNQRDAGA